MSVKIFDLVLQNAPYRGAQLLVLLALADYAGEDGRAWPSPSVIAAKARTTERYARQAIRQLQDDHVITVTEGPRGTFYTIQTAQLAKQNRSDYKKARTS